MWRLLSLCLAGLLIAGVALAEDFWVKKEYMQWTDEEVKQVMTKSPWAKDVTISAPIAMVGGRVGRGPAPSGGGTDVETGSGGGGGRRGGRGGGGGGGGEGGGSEALVTLNISWRSASLLRQALVRSRLGVGAAVPPDAAQLVGAEQENYVIVASGLPAGMGSGLQNTLAEKSTIRVGKKPPVVALAVNVQPRTQSLEVIYLFPKKQMITADDKEVEVVLVLGQIEIKRKFNLKEMVYKGKLDL
jgi:hypothetical protein